MIRGEFWGRSLYLTSWCNEEELNVLSKQAAKALNSRMASYTDKMEAKDRHKRKVGQRKAKAAAIKHN